MESLCGTIGANTGQIQCDIFKGNPAQLIFGAASFTPAQYPDITTLMNNFIGKINQSRGTADKLFPLPTIQANTATTEAAKFDTLGYGLKIKLLRSRQGYTFDVIAGCALEKQLIQFDGQYIPVFVLDNKKQLWGITDSKGNFSGATYLVSVEPADFGDATKAKTTSITISLVNPEDFVENCAGTPTTFRSTDLVGLYDVNVVIAAANASNVYHIGLNITTGGLVPLNLYNKYKALLNSAALWAAFTGANFGTALTLTSVVADATNMGFTVIFDSTAYAALPSGAKIQLSLEDVNTLDAAMIPQLDTEFLIITKP